METRFLVPLDGSELGERTLPWARVLAERTGKRVELLRCHDPLASVYMMTPEFAAAAPAVDHEAYYAEIDAYLASLAAGFEEGAVVLSRREGDPAGIILERCESGEVETVLVASHGKGGLGRWLLGSVATKVVRGSCCPVLVVNSATEVVEPLTVRRILVPLDGSAVSEVALPKALWLARTFDGAQIHLYRAVQKGAPATEARAAEEYLEGLKARYPGVEITSGVGTVPSLNPAIVEEARSCDIVVLSSHGRSGVKRWLLGSVTEKLIQTVNKPLLIVYKRESAKN